MRSFTIATVVLLAACKPPPTDADLARERPADAPTSASNPLPSPDTEGAMWAPSPQDQDRLIYGIPGEPALLALECLHQAENSALPTLRITRNAPADDGAGALLALVGNGAVGRMAVDATKRGSSSVWQGDLAASDTAWDPLDGPRQVTATVPGAGMVTLNPSLLPGELIDQCRNSERAPPKDQG